MTLDLRLIENGALAAPADYVAKPSRCSLSRKGSERSDRGAFLRTRA
jgi:hypothetical protein